jgi:predicted ferric reductase
MSQIESTTVLPSVRLAPIRIGARTAATLLMLALVGNGAAVLWLWLHGGGISIVHNATGLWTSLGRVTGLEGAYLALVQIVLLLRMPWLEQLVGFDRLSRWHRRNGQACIVLVVAHAVLITIGYAGMDGVGFFGEFRTLLSSYPGMVAATIGTGLMVLVGVSSVAIARKRLPYEVWYTVHLTVYTGIALAYLHQIPTGNDLTVNPAQADYWIALYCSVLALIVVFRVVIPVLRLRRYGLRVQRLERESEDVVSVYVHGRNLERLKVRGGQFFLWRFLSRELWWQAHPFSLSAAPDGRTLRLTVKAVGGYTRALDALRPGTRVLIDGPLGRFTAERRRSDRVALIAGGIGVTPLRAILEELPAGEGRVGMKFTRRGFVYALVALLGIAVTAALTWSVSQLAGQRIGLQAVPVSVIHGLAPSTAPTTVSTRRSRLTPGSASLDGLVDHTTLSRPPAAPVDAPQPLAGSQPAIAAPSAAAQPPPAPSGAAPQSRSSGGGGGDGRDDSGGSGRANPGSVATATGSTSTGSSTTAAGSGSHRDD